uniref:Uncharacterized protein n=1 Tax=Arion vulgaris TaxID=1028688 RepID=A0A0B7BZ90_9EUPU
MERDIDKWKTDIVVREQLIGKRYGQMEDIYFCERTIKWKRYGQVKDIFL